MAGSLSNTIKQRLFDPESHNNNRTVFRIPDSNYASNFKLVDCGWVDDAVIQGSGHFNSPTCGVYDTVRNVYLYSDNTLISSTEECSVIGTLEHLKASNEVNKDILRVESLNAWGFKQSNPVCPNGQYDEAAQTGVHSQKGALTLQATDTPAMQPYFNTSQAVAGTGCTVTITTAVAGCVTVLGAIVGGVGYKVGDILNAVPTLDAGGGGAVRTYGLQVVVKALTDAAAGTVAVGGLGIVRGGTGYVDGQAGVAFRRMNRPLLQHVCNSTSVAEADLPTTTGGIIHCADLLGFLQSTQLLPSIPNLRLVIEWNTAVADVLLDADDWGAVTPVLSVRRPTLVMDEIQGLPKEGDFKIPYFDTMLERFMVTGAALADGALDQYVFKSNAFNQRYLKDLVLWHGVTSDHGFMKAKCRSPAMFNEKVQLIVNGSQFLPNNGDAHEGQKALYLTQTVGSLNVPHAAVVVKLASGSEGNCLALDSQPVAAAVARSPLEGQMAVSAYPIEGLIDRLEIQYSRSGCSAATAVLAPDAIAAFTLFVYGRVARMLESKNGKITLSY